MELQEKIAARRMEREQQESAVREQLRAEKRAEVSNIKKRLGKGPKAAVNVLSLLALCALVFGGTVLVKSPVSEDPDLTFNVGFSFVVLGLYLFVVALSLWVWEFAQTRKRYTSDAVAETPPESQEYLSTRAALHVGWVAKLFVIVPIVFGLFTMFIDGSEGLIFVFVGFFLYIAAYNWSRLRLKKRAVRSEPPPLEVTSPPT